MSLPSSLQGRSNLLPAVPAPTQSKPVTCDLECRRLSSRNASASHSHLRRGSSWKVAQQRNSKCQTTVAAVLAEPPAAEALDECPRGSHCQIHKFGGTCVATADRIREAANLIASGAEQGQQVVVVSAMGSHPTSPLKVTDLLLKMVDRASRRDQSFLLDLAAIQDKHVETAKQLLGEGRALNRFVARILDDIANLKAMLQAISIAGMSTDSFSDFVVGHGELWCAQLLSHALQQSGLDAAFMDTREVLVVSPASDGTTVDVEYAQSNANLDRWAHNNGAPQVVVATGFIASNLQGQVTTLKRNGSDYSATILGALFQGSHITIWTDVDGVYSADPRKVPESQCLVNLSYHEAWELSYFGANVLHPRTTLPAMKFNIPISIRNFSNLSAPGTRITDVNADIERAGMQLVKGFATIDNVALINVEGTGMVGVPGTASTIFTTMRDADVNVSMISQASSEHSVCFAVRQSDGPRAIAALQSKFAEAIASGRVSKVEQIPDCCILAAVGQQMASRKGVAATMFAALAKANINIRCIAQGCSEYNITVLIDQRDSVRALRAVHGRFYLAKLTIGLGVIGPGLVGRTFINQLYQQRQELREEFDIDVRVLGITGSSRMLLSDTAISLADWQEQYKSQSQPTDLDAFRDHLASSYVPNTVIIDATASDAPPQHYLEWMRRGIHIITPNKKLNSGPLARYQELRRIQRDSYIHFLYEATVGAGLPIIATLKHLVDTGDRITRVEGIFSGTLSYIFNSLTPDRTFSSVVAEAKANGYTEPDPRDDLSGTDVARKVTILARECGLDLDLENIPIESLVPEPLQSVASADDFMAQLPQYDSQMAEQMASAEAAGECLRFVGVVDCKAGAGSVKLGRYPKSHAFAQLQGSDNIIAFTTQRYSAQPLIVRGPGAGAEVTAGGVFSDLLRLAAYLGAPS
ncbi:hypothetical protein WJX74_011058 [Apatococcus lobatus]|uniref:ACT domain-containing protein n=1 Tax=Apatococcus lobatus TaxID=904363 RepID=A0AAW1RWB5_9CHLO